MNKIRKGDEVIVTTGKDKGRRGTVLQVFDVLLGEVHALNQYTLIVKYKSEGTRL
ncbi:MAG: KOW motif-containing protein, partial [Pseudomonadota bacterium]